MFDRVSQWFTARRRGLFRRHGNRIVVDVVAIFGTALILRMLTYDLDLFEFANAFSRAHEEWELDEIFVTIAFMSLALIVFGVRRIHDQRHELKLRQAAEQHSRILARQDPLTGLPNRRRFMEALSSLPGEMDPNAKSAIFVVDLDGFKPINDVFGHQSGDEALQAIGFRLNKLGDARMIAARLGGDEFALLVRNLTSPEEPRRIAERIIASIEIPIMAGGAEQKLEASVGVAVFGIDEPASEQIRRADIALYRAKEVPHSSIAFYTEDMDRSVQQRAIFERHLRDALAAGRIVPHYQPIVDMRTGEVVKLEALARWMDPTLGEVPPTRFIPVAEQRGLIGELSDMVIRQACRDATAWPSNVLLSVNISPVLLHSRSFGLRLLKILSETGLPPQRLEIEITEKVLKTDVRKVAELLKQFRDAGVRVAIDDFGTGYSSLSRLRELPFDDLKIDQSFVQTMAENSDSALIVDTVLTLGQGLGMTVVAEGVEDPEQRKLLIEAGCTYGQGFLFSRPVPAHAIDALFNAPEKVAGAQG